MTKDAEITIKFKLGEGAILPQYKTEGSAGCDISAAHSATIPAKGWAIIGTQLFPEIPEGYEIQVRSRSGLSFKNGIFVLNSPGTVDSDYRGEIKIILANFSDDSFTVEAGDRIAQLVLARVHTASFIPVSEINKTSRGTGGFGHTGV